MVLCLDIYTSTYGAQIRSSRAELQNTKEVIIGHNVLVDF